LYLLPLSFAAQEQVVEVMERCKAEVIARLTVDGSWGLLYDGGFNVEVHRAVHDLLHGRKRVKGKQGELYSRQAKRKHTPEQFGAAPPPSRVLVETSESSERGGQCNTSVVFDNQLYLKLYRRYEEGTNPDAEMVRFLSDVVQFRGAPRYLASLEYRRPDSEPLIVAMLQEYVTNQGDAWTVMQSALSRYYEEVLMGQHGIPEKAFAAASPVTGEAKGVDEAVQQLIGSLDIQFAELLGRRTAEMHGALASSNSDPLFSPEPFTKLYQRSLYQSLRSRILRSFRVLSAAAVEAQSREAQQIEELLARREEILAALQRIAGDKIAGKKIRIHGDYDLTQVLFTGREFIVIDFEGEAGEAADARGLKGSPLRDVADMIRSFYYAAYGGLHQHTLTHPENLPLLEPYASLWYRSISRVFLSSYRDTIKPAELLPDGRAEQDILLQAYLLEKSISSIVREMKTRPEWLPIALNGALSILSDGVGGG
jgi:maltose alpha-D-glucosyltransferase/alpha-amylase